MAQVKLEARHRTATGKGAARRLRREGRIPAVIYGHGEEPISIDLDQKQANHLLHEFGHNAIIELTVTGGKGSDTCMIVEFDKDIYQRHLVHLDLKRISLKEKIETKVQVVIVGAEKVEKDGGVVELAMQEVEIRALPLEIPEFLEVDISHLELGDNLHVSALKLPAGCELVSDPDSVLVLVNIPRAVVEEVAAAAEGATAAAAPATAEIALGEESLYLVVGLGNPGENYSQTRHNVGFEVVKELLRRHSFSEKKADPKAQTNRGEIRGHSVLLVRPRTYMNLSGDAVQPLMSFFKAPPERLLVLSDDFALPLGRLRLRAGGSAGGQNGLKSIIERLGTEKFPRLRLGIGPVPENWDPANFVLSKVSKADQKVWDESISRAADAVESWLERGLDQTASQFNSNPKGPEECADS